MDPKKILLSQLIEDLRQKGVTYSRLVVVSDGNEQFIGEEPTAERLAGRELTLYNPKRFVRFEMRNPQNPGMVYIDFMMGDLDMIDSGMIQIKPTIGYWINQQSIDCQINMSKLYLEYFERRVKTKAAEANLVIPDTMLIKG
jgi:hypothetical protein